MINKSLQNTDKFFDCISNKTEEIFISKILYSMKYQRSVTCKLIAKPYFSCILFFFFVEHLILQLMNDETRKSC